MQYIAKTKEDRKMELIRKGVEIERSSITKNILKMMEDYKKEIEESYVGIDLLVAMRIDIECYMQQLEELESLQLHIELNKGQV